MAGIDVNALVADIKSAAKGVLSRDVSTLRGFAEEQVKAIAQQAAIVAAGIADSSIGPDIRDFFSTVWRKWRRALPIPWAA